MDKETAKQEVEKLVNKFLAIPYNPYHPELYSRFTMQGFLDEERELYVAEKFWDFLAEKELTKKFWKLNYLLASFSISSSTIFLAFSKSSFDSFLSLKDS